MQKKKIVKTARHSRLCYKDDIDVMEASGDGGQAWPSVGGLPGGTPTLLKPSDCLIPTGLVCSLISDAPAGTRVAASWEALALIQTVEPRPHSQIGVGPQPQG